MDATTAMLASGVPLHDRVGDRGGPACRLPAGYHPINALSIRPRGSIQVASLVVTDRDADPTPRTIRGSSRSVTPKPVDSLP